MRRKNRKWVATAVVLYLFVMWSAYRWAIAQRPTDGNIFEHIEREAKRKNAEARAREEAEAARLKPAGKSRLAAAGPAFVAARYDASHVVFMVAGETESRFASSPQFGGTPTKISAPAKAAAPLAGLQELWEPDSHALHFFPEVVQKTQSGEQWSLNLSPEETIPVVIERAVIAPAGCSLALGFLASVPVEQQGTFEAMPQEYFAVRRTPVAPADPAVSSHIGEISDWKASVSSRTQIEQQLNDRMRREVAKIDTQLMANAGSPGAVTGESPVGHARPRWKEWIHADRGLIRGEGVLDYDVRAFRLSPDGQPRLLVRARWKLVDTPVFLMTAWFREQSQKESLKSAAFHPESQRSESLPTLLWADSSWSVRMREADGAAALGDHLDFESILNEFDADRDGWAELLVYSDQGSATVISLNLYTDMGLVPLKTELRRDSRAPESCVDP